MKHLYLVIAFLFASIAYGQDSQAKGDIDGFKLYPNPATNGKVYVSTTDTAPKEISIFDVLGTQVLQTTIIGNELALSDLDAGVYIIRVYQNNKMATRKLVVK